VVADADAIAAAADSTETKAPDASVVFMAALAAAA